MIAQTQRSKIAEKLLTEIYKKGRLPGFLEYVALLEKNYRYKEFGKPFFAPRGAEKTSIVSSQNLKSNVEEIKEDLETSYETLVDLLLDEATEFVGTYGELRSIRQRLILLLENVETYLSKEYSNGIITLFDNFRNTDKVDLSLTTAYLDTDTGQVSLPVALDKSVRYSARDSKLTAEKYSDGYKSVASSFLSVFNDYGDQTWQATLPEGGYYQAEVNITGKSVAVGHSNEVEINRIVVDPIGSFNLLIEGSVDGLNWFPITSQVFSTRKSIEFAPIWVLYLRFTISNNTVAGIRGIEISRVGTTDSALLFSKALTSTTPIYSLDFSAKTEIPYGTEIKHYLFTGPNSNWTPITPGSINLNVGRKQVLTFGASGDFSADIAADPATLYKYALPTNSALIESGELRRGIGQFKVECFDFDYTIVSDPNHIPDSSDWNSPRASRKFTCYMDSLGTTTSNSLPTGLNNKNTFLFNYSNAQQDWFGVVLWNATNPLSGFILQNKHNYRITTYLYVDRDVVIDNFAGGIYTLGVGTPTYTNTEAWGWSIYVNSQRVVGSNEFYVGGVPGSGSISADFGRTFPTSLKIGWNKLEILIYVPDATYIDSGIRNNNFNVVALFRPDIFNFMVDSSRYSATPTLSSYPIWGDGVPLSKVSEFYLRWNTPPWNNESWAWRIEATSGTPTHVLLNYNPMVQSSDTTIDGRFKGNMPSFNLSFTYVNEPIYNIYYKAELKRNNAAIQSPKLFGYKFNVLK